MHSFNPMLRRQRLPRASLVYMGNYRPDRTIHSKIFQKRGRHAGLVTPWYKWWFIIPKAQVQFPVCLFKIQINELGGGTDRAHL